MTREPIVVSAISCRMTIGSGDSRPPIARFQHQRGWSMADPLTQQFETRLASLNSRGERFAVEVVDLILKLAREQAASDVHLLPQPQPGELEILLRLDGVLQRLGRICVAGPNVISRLKVLANLLTYRSDVPQEGRVRTGEEQLEMRVSTFPTMHGEKTVVRLFVGSGSYRYLHELGFPPEIQSEVERLLLASSGLFVACGPAGSGKTTTLYAALRHIQQESGALRSICTLEDPIEALLPGVSQSQVKPEGEFTYQRGLASLMRQDPEVILVGEVRDRETARIAFQASLTGHLVLTSFHSGNAADAVSRFSDMQVEPYVLRSGLLAILAQRLLRRSCPECRGSGCDACGQSGYRGRFVIGELLKPDLKGLGRAILDRNDAEQIEELAVEAGMVPLIDHAIQAVHAGRTSQAEFVRLFGPDRLP
jgi:general secretion pathway protein E